MSEAWWSKAAYYRGLYKLALGFSSGLVKPLKEQTVDLEFLRGRSIYFYVPTNTAGAQFIVYDLIPALGPVVQRVGARLEVSTKPPDASVDWLVSFKSSALLGANLPAKNHVLLICDEAEKLWSKIPNFDWVVSTSSQEFTTLCSFQNSKTVFLSEFESTRTLEIGRLTLQQKPFKELNTVGWHGGDYSKSAALSLVPSLTRFAKGLGKPIRFLLVGGKRPQRTTHHDLVEVEEIPWSLTAMERFSRECRLAILPSRDSLRTSFLKPAARMRKSFALGVPALGDGRVPEVRRLSRELGLPSPVNTESWEEAIKGLWHSQTPTDLAWQAWGYINDRYSDRVAAQAWCTFFRMTDA